MAGSKKGGTAAKKNSRQARRKKPATKKVIALSAREPVKTKSLKSVVIEKRVRDLRGDAERPRRRKLASATRVPMPDKRKASDAGEDGGRSVYAGHLELFAALIEWSPLAMLLRQQALVAQVMFGQPGRAKHR